MPVQRIVKILLVTQMITGFFSAYAPGVMDRTIVIQQGYGHISDPLPEHTRDCSMAVRDCEDIGKTFWIRSERHPEWRPCVAVDCASQTDRQSESDPRSGRQWMEDGNWIAELNAKNISEMGIGEFNQAWVARRELVEVQVLQHKME